MDLNAAFELLVVGVFDSGISTSNMSKYDVSFNSVGGISTQNVTARVVAETFPEAIYR